jgi:helicase SWR1
VHIYRLVSEHTIEANILRKASQKQMLDDVVIQEGEFTTDYFNKLSVRDVLSEKLDSKSEGLDAADAALDRVLGGPDTNSDQRRVGRALEQAEDREDVAAARVAEKEIQADDADFTEKPSNNASGTSTARQGTPAGKSVLDGGLDDIDTPQAEEVLEYNAWGDKMHTIDDYMLGIMAEQLKDTKLELPKDKKKGKKKGKDTRKR